MAAKWRYGALVDSEAWAYDGAGNEISHTWNDGKVTTSTYDGDNRLILQVTRDSLGNFLYQESWQYDADGNMVLHVDPLGRQTHWTYDGLGRKLTETVAYGTSQAATTQFAYDTDGNEIRVIDPVGNETEIPWPLGSRPGVGRTCACRTYRLRQRHGWPSRLATTPISATG